MDAVVFDMDGVLVDSVGYKQEVRRALLQEELGLDVEMDDLVGLNKRDKYDHLVETTELDVPFQELFRQLDAEVAQVYGQKVRLLPVLDDLLDELRGRGLRVGLASAADRTRVELALARFDLHDEFDIILSRDDIDGESKPAPDLYLAAASDMGVDPERVVAVEDSEHGARAAVRAGMYVVGFEPPENPDQDLSHADETAATPEELQAAVLDAVEE